MNDTPNTQQPELTGNVLFYKNPQPLNPKRHAALGVKQVEQPFAFLRNAHAVPVTVSEFGTASGAYPIIFVGDDLTPIAVMGIRQNENLFVEEDGTVPPDFYIPAFIRRYPFVFANDNKNDRLLLCVDRDAPMVSNQPDIPFFEDEQPTEFTKNAIEFCKEFERQRRTSVEFSTLMRKLDLFEEKSVAFQPRDAKGEPVGEQQKIADYMAISEEKLNGLSDEQFKEIRGSGALGAIYAHMISLLNWQRIIRRAARKIPAPANTQTPT